jgi:hypothetical protein
MKPFRILVSAVSLILCGLWISCTPIEPTLENTLLETVWVLDQEKTEYIPTILFAYKSQTPTFKALDYTGFQMKANGEYISFANTSFCGTPPTINGEFKGGTWKKLDDKRIAVAMTFWQQGSFLYDTLEIVSLKNNELALRSLRQ